MYIVLEHSVDLFTYTYIFNAHEGCKVLGKKILWYYNVIAEIPQYVAHVVGIAFDLKKITKSCKEG